MKPAVPLLALCAGATRQSPPHAYGAFYWAARLAPWSADPLYAQWVAFHPDSYVFKASAHELLGQTDSARVAYHGYLARAARNAQNRSLATRRLTALDEAAR